MADATYNRSKLMLLDGELDFEANTLKVLLVTSGYTFDADHDYVSDLTPGSNELSGTGYSRKTLATLTTTLDDANDLAYFDAADVTWSGINAGTADAAIIYKEVTTDADSPLIAYIDTGGFPVATNGGDLTISWSANGILKIS